MPFSSPYGLDIDLGRPPDVLSVENTTPNWWRQIYEDLFHRPLWANPTTQSTVGQIGGRILYSIADAFYVTGTNLFGTAYHFDGSRATSTEVTDAGLSVLAEVVLIGSGSALKATKSAGKSVDEILVAGDEALKAGDKIFISKDGLRKMDLKVFEAEHNNLDFKIEEDYPEVEIYLYVYENGNCIRDFL